MNYQDIIQQETIKAELAAAAAEELKKQHLAKIAVQHSTIKARWEIIILPEMEKAQTALAASGYIAVLGNGSFCHGTRRSLHLCGQVLVFMGIWSDPELPAEILHRIEHGAPTNDTHGATTLGDAKEITPAVIQKIIADFIKQALA